MVVLREILLSAVRAGDPLTAWSAAARLLRSYYPLITPAGQNGLANALSNSSERLPPGTRCADPALPFIRYLLGYRIFFLQFIPNKSYSIIFPFGSSFSNAN